HDDSRTRAMSYFIQLLQKRNRFEVLAPAKLVRYPLTFLAAVVEIKHRRDCIDAQSIDVKLVEPVQRIRDEEVAYFIATVVEDVRAQTGMLTVARGEMLVQSRAIEAAERPRVFRKVGRNPVHDHADAALVQVVDQITQIVGLAVTRGGRV